MPTLLTTRRALAAAVFAAAAITPIAVPFHAAAAACPRGEEGDLYTGTCTPVLVPNSPAPAAALPAANLCPPGVSGAECQPTTGNQAGPTMPQAPGQIQPAGPEQELEDVSTPDY